MRLGTVFEQRDNVEAMTRGTLVHGCLALVKWLDDSIPTKHQLQEHLRSI